MNDNTLTVLREMRDTIKRIRQYRNAKLFTGGGIRWLLTDEKGTSVYCDKCGNIANCVKHEKVWPHIFGGFRLKVPLCKRHARELLESEQGWKYSERSLALYQPKHLPQRIFTTIKEQQ